MKIEIDLNDRLYKQLQDFCKLNGLLLNIYLLDKIEQGFSVDRFGDLNVIKGITSPQEVETDEMYYKQFVGSIKSMTYNNITSNVNIEMDDGYRFEMSCKEITPIEKINTEKSIETTRKKSEVAKTIKRRQIKSN